MYKGLKILRGQFDLKAYFSGADKDAVRVFGRTVHKGRERLFHSHGGTSAVNVSGQGV